MRAEITVPAYAGEVTFVELDPSGLWPDVARWNDLGREMVIDREPPDGAPEPLSPPDGESESGRRSAAPSEAAGRRSPEPSLRTRAARRLRQLDLLYLEYHRRVSPPSGLPLPPGRAALVGAASGALLASAIWAWGGDSPEDAFPVGSVPTVEGEGTDRGRGEIDPRRGAEPVFEAQGLRVPVRGVSPDELVDTWGAPRSGDRGHEGLDIMAPRGTPVLAAANGRILRRYRSSSGGRTIYQIGERGRLVFYYAHLDRWAGDLEEGDTVRAGDVIGYVGDSGNAAAGVTHLHFEIIITPDPERWWGGVSVNPYRVLTGLAEG